MSSRVGRWLIASLGAALIAGCASTTPIQIGDNRVYSPPLRMAMDLPPGWRLVPAKEIREAQKQIHTTNKTFNYLVYQGRNLPFVMLVRGDEGREETAVVVVDRPSLEASRLASSDQAAQMMLWGYLHIMSDAKAVAPIVTVKVGGQSFSTTRVRYSLREAGGPGAATIERRMWVKSLGLSALTIEGAFDLKDAAVVEPDIDRIVRSIAWNVAP